MDSSIKDFLTVGLDGLTKAALYFIVASGFTLIFGLMRTTNMAHGSLYLLGAYVGYSAAHATGNWFVGVVVAAVVLAGVGFVLYQGLIRWMPGEDLRQALVTLGLSIVVADLLLASYGGLTKVFAVPDEISGRTALPLIEVYPTYRLVLIAVAVLVGAGLWLFLSRTKIGSYIRAGIDDRGMLAALGVNVARVFAFVFALGAALAGFAGVIGGSALSISPGEDVRYLLASLVVVIVGGMGSLGGAAVGALIIGLSEQYGLYYAPTISIFVTFAIMAAVLAVRPQGIMGRPA